MRKRRSAGSAHTLIIDRWLDDETASVELDGTTGVVMPRALLPPRAGPDDVLRVERRAARVTVVLDPQATDAARREGEALAARLKGRDPGGDVVL